MFTLFRFTFTKRHGHRSCEGTGPDAISTSLCRLRRLTNECRLEEYKNTRDFPIFEQKSGGGGYFLCGHHQAEKWGERRVPQPPPIYAHAIEAMDSMQHRPPNAIKDVSDKKHFGCISDSECRPAASPSLSRFGRPISLCR